MPAQDEIVQSFESESIIDGQIFEGQVIEGEIIGGNLYEGEFIDGQVIEGVIIEDQVVDGKATDDQTVASGTAKGKTANGNADASERPTADAEVGHSIVDNQNQSEMVTDLSAPDVSRLESQSVKVHQDAAMTAIDSQQTQATTVVAPHSSGPFAKSGMQAEWIWFLPLLLIPVSWLILRFLSRPGYGSYANETSAVAVPDAKTGANERGTSNASEEWSSTDQMAELEILLKRKTRAAKNLFNDKERLSSRLALQKEAYEQLNADHQSLLAEYKTTKEDLDDALHQLDSIGADI